MSPSPWAYRRSFRRDTSSFSSRTNRLFGSSLMTALQRICLARSAYLWIWEKKTPKNNRRCWHKREVENKLLMSKTLQPERAATTFDVFNVIQSLPSTWGCWGFHRSWCQLDSERQSSPFENFPLATRRENMCISILQLQFEFINDGNSKAHSMYPSSLSAARLKLSLYMEWSFPLSSSFYSVQWKEAEFFLLQNAGDRFLKKIVKLNELPCFVQNP